jgi:hypothetical protein
VRRTEGRRADAALIGRVVVLRPRAQASVLSPEVVAPTTTDLPYVGDAIRDGKTDAIIISQG